MMIDVSFRVLLTWPPAIPTYFNAGHRLPLWEVSAYIQKHIGSAEVDVVDLGLLDRTWKEAADILLRNYHLICILNEFENIEGLKRFVEYARAISPDSKLLTFGRVSGVIPRYFTNYSVDAIVHSGDFEVGVLTYCEMLLGKRSVEKCDGLLVHVKGEWLETKAGHFLDAENWEFPKVQKLPLESYARLSARPENRFSALPGQTELTIGVSRGCPVGCNFCLIPMYQGLHERRRSPISIVEYLQNAKESVHFDYVSMFSPTFTLDRKWTKEFCESMEGLSIKWKCCTTVQHLDRELVLIMGRSKCIRISVGIETLEIQAQKTLPRIKQTEYSRLSSLAKWCSEADIELNCFVMVGMPGQTIEGLKSTFETIKALGAQARPTAYTAFGELKETVSESELLRAYTRQLLCIVPGENAESVRQLNRAKFLADC